MNQLMSNVLKNLVFLDFLTHTFGSNLNDNFFIITVTITTSVTVKFGCELNLDVSIEIVQTQNLNYSVNVFLKSLTVLNFNIHETPSLDYTFILQATAENVKNFLS